MTIRRTRHGLRLSQHGVVISELRTSPGPTHSVFDVLAALIDSFPTRQRTGVLGFAGGGMMAPLRGLGWDGTFDTVDLDEASYALFLENCPAWTESVRWHHADALDWLHRQRARFGLLLEDLSIPRDGDVTKPDICWNELPGLIRDRLAPGGVALFNLLTPNSGRWKPELPRLASHFAMVRVIHFDEYDNRILVAGEILPSARELSARLAARLKKLRSRQFRRISVRST